MMMQVLRTRKMTLLTLAALSMLAFGCAAGGTQAGNSVPAGQGYLDTISVTGFGESVGAPDTGTIQLGFSTSNASIEQAMNESNATLDGITQAVVALGVDPADVQTTNFSVWPEDRYDPVTGMPTGEKSYRVDNSINVVVRDLSLMPQVIQTALDHGANNLYGLNFTIEEDSQLAAQARANAVADARVRAEQLASELGVTLGEARIASEVYNNNAGPMIEAAYGMGGGGAPPISEGSLTVSIQVVVTYDIVR
jgi:uncharacterized protein YggE